MDKEKLKQIKAVYYPYKAAKKAVLGSIYVFKYLCSLHYIKVNKKRVQEKVKNKETLNVVFIVQYIPGWNKLEPIYTKMKQDNRFNPIIFCVPLNIQNHKLMDDNGNDTYEYFVNHGYDAIDSLQETGTWYDLKQLQPDYVFHSRPYNHFMPEEYTSGRIVKYALICNVMYGLSLTHNVEPLLLNKEYFKDCFCYFALDDGEKEYFEKRFFVGIEKGIQKCEKYGGIGLENIFKSKEERSQDDTKKTIIWTPRWSTDPKIGGSNYFNYKDLMIKLVESHKECMFIFRPHPLMFDNFVTTGEMTIDDVKKFKQYCKETDNLLLDETKEYCKTFWQSDLLITDGSAIVPEYFVTGKPIMFCQSNISESNTDFYNMIISQCYEVYSKEDLLFYFDKIISGMDEKKTARIEFANKMMIKYENNSKKIVEMLTEI